MNEIEEHRYETRGRQEVFAEFKDLVPRDIPLKDARGLAHKFVVQHGDQFQQFIEKNE